MKNVTIDGNRFELRLPTSIEWDAMMDDLGESNDLWHWDGMFSWCEDKMNSNPSGRVYRGYFSARYFNWSLSGYRNAGRGFRPVLAPLGLDALKLDNLLFSDMEDGSKHYLGSLYLDGITQRRPENSVFRGDVPRYNGKAEIRIGDSDLRREYQIGWVKWNGLLIADRNILRNVSWDQLSEEI